MFYPRGHSVRAYLSIAFIFAFLLSAELVWAQPGISTDSVNTQQSADDLGVAQELALLTDLQVRQQLHEKILSEQRDVLANSGLAWREQIVQGMRKTEFAFKDAVTKIGQLERLLGYIEIKFEEAFKQEYFALLFIAKLIAVLLVSACLERCIGFVFYRYSCSAFINLAQSFGEKMRVLLRLFCLRMLLLMLFYVSAR